MATTFTHKLENFFDNNTPGGYIQTSINITDSELDARINQKFQNQNYLTSTSMIPASQITGLSTVATSGRYSDLIGITGTNVSISNTLTEGVRLATITINGVSTDIYGNDNNTTIDIPTFEEIDPIFSRSVAANITNDDISYWNGKSNFNGSYIALTDKPNLLQIKNYNFIDYDNNILNELLNNNRPIFIHTDQIIDHEQEKTFNNILIEMIQSYNNILEIAQVNIILFNNIRYTISNITENNNIFTINFIPKYFTNYTIIDKTDKTNQEILDELQINKTDNMIWEYDRNNNIIWIK